MVLCMYEMPGSYVDVSAHGGSDMLLAFPDPVDSTEVGWRVIPDLVSTHHCCPQCGRGNDRAHLPEEEAGHWKLKGFPSRSTRYPRKRGKQVDGAH